MLSNEMREYVDGIIDAGDGELTSFILGISRVLKNNIPLYNDIVHYTRNRLQIRQLKEEYKTYNFDQHNS